MEAARALAALLAAAVVVADDPPRVMAWTPSGRDGFGSQYFGHMAVFGACRRVPGTWSSGGRDYASVVFQVGRSAGVLEFFSDVYDAAELRTLAAGYEVSHTPRFAFEAGATPSDVFAWDDAEYVQAAAVSHFVSDLERSHAFQTAVLGMTQIDEFVRGDDLTRVYVTAPNSDAPFAAVQVHLTYRPEVAGEAFSVRDFEDVLNAAHDDTLVDAYCGFDTWLDFHYRRSAWAARRRRSCRRARPRRRGSHASSPCPSGCSAA